MSKDGVRRIERLINLIAALLETRRPLTAEEIRRSIAGYGSESLEAFRRAFERDKADLRAWGIPIETERLDVLEETLGYTIPKDRYYLPDLELEPDELAALRLAAASLIGGGPAVEGALKIEAREEEAAVPVVAWGADLAVEQPHAAALFDAVVEKTPVSFDYRPAAGSDVEPRRLEPYALVHRRGHWYAVGRDMDRDAARSFRLSRVASPPTPLAGSFEVPDDFDPDRLIGGEPWEVGPGRGKAVVRFDAEIAWWPEQNLHGAEIVRRDDEATDVELPIGNLSALVSWVAGFGGRVEILSPPEARAAIVDHVAGHLEPRA